MGLAKVSGERAGVGVMPILRRAKVLDRGKVPAGDAALGKDENEAPA